MSGYSMTSALRRDTIKRTNCIIIPQIFCLSTSFHNYGLGASLTDGLSADVKYVAQLGYTFN